MATTDAPSQPICPLGVSDRMLSALRDDVVSRAEAARLAAHVETCPACRERLAVFDNLASTLRSERAPEPDGARLWQAIILAASSRGRAHRFSGAAHLDISWRRLSAIAVVIVLCVGFFTVFSLHRPTSSPPVTPTATLTPEPTSTPTALPTATVLPALLPARPLVWQPVAMPGQKQSTVFANDGETAYMCAVGDVGGNGALSIRHTSDRGAHWIPARVVPNDPTMNTCDLVVDASDPTVAALAWAPRGAGGGDPFTGLMTTVDGGATWQATPSTPFTRIDQLDSRGGVIYALRETVDSANTIEYHVWASADRMGSWRQVDHGLPSVAAGFWLQPDGSGIVIAIDDTTTQEPVPAHLWSSPDDGGTWRLIDVPGTLPFYGIASAYPFGTTLNGIVVRSIQGQFHICVADFSDLTNPAPVVHCSTDSGATWQTHSAFPATRGDRTVYAGPQRALIDITDDGSLLGLGSDLNSSNTLYRLAAGSDQWQPLGTPPVSAVIYRPAPAAGSLWAIPGYGWEPQQFYFTNYIP